MREFSSFYDKQEPAVSVCPLAVNVMHQIKQKRKQTEFLGLIHAKQVKVYEA